MKLSGGTRVAEGLSRREHHREAVEEAIEQVLEGVGASPDLATVFFTGHHLGGAEAILEQLQERLGADVTVGVSASGVIGGGQEIQVGPGLTLWAARLPGTKVQDFHLSLEESEDHGIVRGWPEVEGPASAVLLSDPFSFPLEPFLSSLRGAKFGLPQIVGGQASAGTRPKTNVLIGADRVHRDGAVGFLVEGSARLQPLVTQGCRPVGPKFMITRCERNVIYELEGAGAASELDDLMDEMSEDDRQRFSQYPHVGVVVTPEAAQTAEVGSSGVLIRRLMGIDKQTGAVAVDHLVHQGTTVQFYARDQNSADEEMDSMLGLASSMNTDALGGLLFSCTGRGVYMFGRPHHDVELVRRYFPDLPLSGFFANGEIGPVCGEPYMHTFTASMGLLVPDRD